MSTIGGLLLPDFSPVDYGAAMNRGILGGREQIQGQTALLTLAEEKQKQAAQQAIFERIKNDPELAQRLFGEGSIIGSLQTAPGGPPGQPPGGGPITQSPLGGDAAQQIPAYPDASRFANVPPTGGGPIPPNVMGQVMPTVTPPPGTPTLATLGPQGGMPGAPQGAPQAPQNPLLEMARRDPRAAMMLQQQLQARQEQQLGMGVKVAEFVARELQGVTDQASLDAARERIRQVHPQAAAQVPQMYSKEAVASVQQRGIAISDMALWNLNMAKARKANVESEMLPKLLEQEGVGGMPQAPAGEAPAAQAPAGAAGNMGQRMNNPYNIKLDKSTQHWVDEGLAEVGESAQDGGKFIKFKDPQVGERAGLELLQGPGYRELSVDAALKRWSNNGYGAEIITDIPPETKIKDLSAAQMRPLMAAMREREGWNAKPTGGGTAQAPPEDPRVAGLRAQIKHGQAKAKQYALLGYESMATQYNKDVDDLQKEVDRLEAPRRAYETKLATAGIEKDIAGEQGRQAAQIKADTEPASKEEIDAVNRAQPPEKRVPYGTTRKALREQGRVGGELLSPTITTELTATTRAIQDFEALSNAAIALPTGPLTQYVETFKERWGIDISDEKVAQRAILAGATNQLLKARSGGAITDGEHARLLNELPNEGNDPKVFKARLANTLRQFKNDYKTKVQILRKTGHAIPDDLMEPLAAPEAPPAPKVSTAVDKARDIMKPR